MELCIELSLCFLLYANRLMELNPTPIWGCELCLAHTVFFIKNRLLDLLYDNQHHPSENPQKTIRRYDTPIALRVTGTPPLSGNQLRTLP